MSRRVSVLVAMCMAPAIGSAQAPERAQATGMLSAQAGLASGLVRRGIDLSDEAVIPKLDIALEHHSGFYLHGGLTRASLPEPRYYENARESTWETLADVGYQWNASERWSIALAYRWYLYSGDLLGMDPDYDEWSVSVDYNGYLAIEYAHAGELWGLDTRQDVFELTGRWPFSRQLFGAASLGHVDQDGLYDDRYQYIRLNLGYLIGSVSLQIQYHDSRGAKEFYADGRYGSEWVAEVNWHW